MKVFRVLYEIILYQIKNTRINMSKSYSLPVTFYFLHHEWFEIVSEGAIVEIGQNVADMK